MDFSENIISWNVANWITVVLMAMLGYFILALVANLVRNKHGELNNA